MSSFSIDAFCESQHQVDLEQMPVSSQKFLQALSLPFFHPFCQDDATSFEIVNVPPMGSDPILDDSATFFETYITLFHMVVPPFIASLDLCIRLLAGFWAPLGIFLLILWQGSSLDTQQRQQTRSCKNKAVSAFQTSVIYVGTVLSALIIMTDSNYVYFYGHGIIFFFASLCLTLQGCNHHKLRNTRRMLGILCIIAIYLTWEMKTCTFNFGDIPKDVPHIQDGLYYDHGNPFIEAVAESWPNKTRVYSIETGATPWIVTGDAMTGLPFLLNRVPSAMWTRVWMPTVDNETIALDISFPNSGHNTSNPVFLIFHGLNGGSSAGYVQDFVDHQTAAGSTVIVMVARGLMDTPIRGMTFFHTASIDDARVAAETVKRATSTGNQILAGVGYSIGAGILSNYVASTGPNCALDAAFAISGALDSRQQEHFTRSKRLWQPMIAAKLRYIDILPKLGKRLRSKLANEEMKGLLRATTVTEVFRYTGAIYHGYKNESHFHAEMDPLGDIPIEKYNLLDNVGKISNVSIPLCVLHALDDPILTWQANVANKGFMHPENLVRTGKGNLMFLLTKTGGHVGWPLGWIPSRRKWEFINNAVSDFVAAIVQASKKNGI